MPQQAVLPLGYTRGGGKTKKPMEFTLRWGVLINQIQKFSVCICAYLLILRRTESEYVAHPALDLPPSPE